jgi:hypothetical protein
MISIQNLPNAVVWNSIEDANCCCGVDFVDGFALIVTLCMAFGNKPDNLNR